MTRRLFPLFLLLALCLPAGALHAADPPAPPVIILPDNLPAPPNPPSPQTAVKLNQYQSYVFRANAPVIVRATPAGLVKVTKDAGPLKVRTWFTNGFKPETKLFTEKYVISVDPAATGRCELLIIPTGTANEDDIVSVILDVDNGTPPVPPAPPIPPNPPPPIPPPAPPVPPAPTAGPLWVVAVIDNANRTAAMTAVLADTALEKRLNDAGHRWKVYDPNAAGTPIDATWKPFITEAGGVPCLIILDKTGRRLKAVKFPADSASVDKLVADALGGK
jgi:hypothetical protein